MDDSFDFTRSHADGDPDQPIVVGRVYEPSDDDGVSYANQFQCIPAVAETALEVYDYGGEYAQRFDGVDKGDAADWGGIVYRADSDYDFG